MPVALGNEHVAPLHSSLPVLVLVLVVNAPPAPLPVLLVAAPPAPPLLVFAEVPPAPPLPVFAEVPPAPPVPPDTPTPPAPPLVGFSVPHVRSGAVHATRAAKIGMKTHSMGILAEGAKQKVRMLRLRDGKRGPGNVSHVDDRVHARLRAAPHADPKPEIPRGYFSGVGL
jgi:hypothetical protein